MNANCTEHPERDAVGACVGCGHFICEECRVLFGGRNWCKRCIERGESPAGRGPSARASSEPGVGDGRLYRSRRDHVFGGVCGGFAAHARMDPTLIRVLVACSLLFTAFVTGIVYIVLWATLPLEPR